MATLRGQAACAARRERGGHGGNPGGSRGHPGEGPAGEVPLAEDPRPTLDQHPVPRGVEGDVAVDIETADLEQAIAAPTDIIHLREGHAAADHFQGEEVGDPPRHAARMDVHDVARGCGGIKESFAVLDVPGEPPGAPAPARGEEDRARAAMPGGAG